MTLFLLVLLAALVFEYINGFHDTANAIATVVSTKVLTPRQAILWATCWNLVGALMGTAVAATIGKGLVDANAVTMTTVLSALIGAIIWGLLTWWLGLPSSSSHALIGGLCGAALATTHGNWSALTWSVVDAKGHHSGLWPKVVLPMFSSPLLGFIGGAILMYFLIAVLRKVRPKIISMLFGKLQLVSAGFMGYSHGSNDAQKTMGHHHSGPLHGNPERNFQRSAFLAPLFEYTCLRSAALGDVGLRPHYGNGYGSRRLSHHPNHGAQDGETPARAWLRGRDNCSTNHPWRHEHGRPRCPPLTSSQHLSWEWAPRRGSAP